MTRNLVGTAVGSIRLTALLGSGGMGEVYRGFDTRLQRQVAVKTIRAEYRPDASIKARFVREARLLSKLDDPSICKVYDLVEGDKADFLIFELVEGTTLRQMLKETLERRRCLELAEQIARALAVAHREQIVHRDLKPENVMVTPEGRIKILDFGISAVLGDASTPVTLAIQDLAAVREAALSHAFRDEEPTVPVGRNDLETGPTVSLRSPAGSARSPERLTRQGSVLGTIRYMSPEQARGEEVLPSSDLYALGVMLQEMLTGEPAYERREAAPLLASVAAAESRPLVDDDPELTRLVDDLKQLRPQLRPDAESTAERLRSILDAPARRLRRRVRRLVVGTAFAIAVLFIVLLSRANLEARDARRQAEAERDRANTQAELASAVTSFVTDLLKDAGAASAAGRDVGARELLQTGAAKIERDTGLEDRPLVRAGVQEVLGASLAALGDFDRALSLQRSCLDLRRAHLPSDHGDLAVAAFNLAVTLSELGEDGRALHHLAEAERILGKTGPVHRLTLGDALHEKGNVLSRLGRVDEADAALSRALDLRRHDTGPRSEDVAATMTSLGLLCQSDGQTDRARDYLAQALDIFEDHLPAGHPQFAVSHNSLALLYRQVGRYGQAAEHYDAALRIAVDAFGPDHFMVAGVLFGLGRLNLLQGEAADAFENLERSLEVRRRSLGPDHFETARSLIWSAAAAHELGRADAAGRLREGLAVLRGTDQADLFMNEAEDVAARLGLSREEP